jgi:hypothetical protein
MTVRSACIPVFSIHRRSSEGRVCRARSEGSQRDFQRKPLVPVQAARRRSVGVLTDDGREEAAEGIDDFDGEVAARAVSLSCSPLIAELQLARRSRQW